MNFGSHEVRCWGGNWSIKCKFFSSHCESHSVQIFFIGPNVAEDKKICDLSALVDFLPVDEK